MTATLRVGYYLENYLAGGLERFLFDILRNLPRETHEVTVFYAGDRSFPDRVAGVGDLKLVWVPIFSVKRLEDKVWARRPSRFVWRVFLLFAEALRWLFAALNVGSCRRAFREHPVDVLHAVNGGYPAAMSCLSAIVAARREGVARTVLCLTGVPGRRRWPILERLVDGRIAVAADWIVSCCRRSAELAEERRGFPARKNRVVYPALGNAPAPDPAAVDRARRSLLGDRAPVIGNVSALEFYKGHRFLVEALKLLKPRYPKLACLIVGGGKEAEELRRLARTLGVENDLVLTGFMPGDAAPAIALMDVFVHPTLEDSFPYVVQEAMALGKPIVATTVGGIPEQIVDGESGRLVEPGNARAIADAVAGLLEDPERARAMGLSAAARRARLFTLEKMMESISATYRSPEPDFASGPAR